MSTDAAALIRKSRQDANLSQQQLADRCGTAQSAVSRWERGHDEPRLSTLEVVLKACDRKLVLSVEIDRQSDGVDRAQLRQQLAMTPDERLASVVNLSKILASARRIP